MESNQIQELKSQLAALNNRIAELESSDEGSRGGRRNMLKLAAGAAAGAMAGGLAFGARPASAAATNIQSETTVTAAGPAAIARKTSGFTNPNNWGLLHLTDEASVSSTGSSQVLSLLSVFSDVATPGAGIAARIQPATGTALAYGAKLDAPVPLKLMDSGESAATIPTTGYAGSFRVHGGNLYFCVQSNLLGTESKYRRIAGPTSAGSFHAVTPFRAYDSRKTAYTANGALAPNTNRVVSVADAHDGNSGAVTVANSVPSGATAVAYNITATGCTGTNFFAVEPGNSTVYSASAVNFTQGQNIANASVCKLDTSRQLKIFCGDDAGSADFIIDIVGYYL